VPFNRSVTIHDESLQILEYNDRSSRSNELLQVLVRSL
jgi:hypothetical protein